jgi:hypothetical protein
MYCKGKLDVIKIMKNENDDNNENDSDEKNITEFEMVMKKNEKKLNQLNFILLIMMIRLCLKRKGNGNSIKSFQ